MESKSHKLPKITFNSPVVLAFVFICVAVQIASTITGGMITRTFFTSRIGAPFDPLVLFCSVSHIFGHAGWEHLINNMSYILLLGPLLEEKYGSVRLVWIMLASALAASVANAVLLHTAVVGASGIVFTFILLSSITGLKEGELPLTFLLVAALYFGQQIYGALFVRDNVSYLGHIAGGVVGAVVGFLLPPKESAAPSGFGLG